MPRKIALLQKNEHEGQLQSFEAANNIRCSFLGDEVIIIVSR
jgi:hypothetical protein